MAAMAEGLGVGDLDGDLGDLDSESDMESDGLESDHDGETADGADNDEDDDDEEDEGARGRAMGAEEAASLSAQLIVSAMRGAQAVADEAAAGRGVISDAVMSAR